MVFDFERGKETACKDTPIIVLSIAFFILSGCIERYYPEEEELKTGTLVVVAHFNNLPGEQSVFISRSTTLQYPENNPISGCYVELMALDGSKREFLQYEPGVYRSNLDAQFLRTGEAYCLVFITPEGERYESEFEKVHPAPEIDSLYYIREDHPASEPGTVDQGIQFYMDFEIEKDSGRYFRWQLIETYEIQNPDYCDQDI